MKKDGIKYVDLQGVACSFCAKSQTASRMLISAAPDLTPAFICDECVITCVDLLVAADVLEFSTGLQPIFCAPLPTLTGETSNAKPTAEPNPPEVTEK